MFPGGSLRLVSSMTFLGGIVVHHELITTMEEGLPLGLQRRFVDAPLASVSGLVLNLSAVPMATRWSRCSGRSMKTSLWTHAVKSVDAVVKAIKCVTEEFGDCVCFRFFQVGPVTVLHEWICRISTYGYTVYRRQPNNSPLAATLVEGLGVVGREVGREGKGREGKGREGKGREGKGREGKGKGREGKGREGKGLMGQEFAEAPETW